jgi:hypothetical protein
MPVRLTSTARRQSAGRDLVDGAPRAGDTGVVDEDVDPPPRVADGGEQARDRLVHGHVGDHRDGVLVAGRGLQQRVLVPPGESHPVPRVEQRPRDRPAEPGARACDDRHRRPICHPPVPVQ